MGNYKNWSSFVAAMEIHNEKARRTLCHQQELRSMRRLTPENSIVPQNSSTADSLNENSSMELVQLKLRIIRRLQDVIPKEERRTTGCCILVSLEELRTVRSLNPADYQVKAQIRLVSDILTDCESTADLQNALRDLCAYGMICNGSHLLTLNASIKSVLQQYISPSKDRKQNIVKIG